MVTYGGGKPYLEKVQRHALREGRDEKVARLSLSAMADREK